MAVYPSRWPSVYPQVSGLVPLDEFSCNLLSGTLIKICRETTNFFKIEQKYRHFIWKSKYHCNVDFCVKYFVTRQQFPGNTFLAFLWQHWRILYSWQQHIDQQRKTVRLFCVRLSDNNYRGVPKYYVTCVLTILLILFICLYFFRFYCDNCRSPFKGTGVSQGPQLKITTQKKNRQIYICLIRNP